MSKKFAARLAKEIHHLSLEPPFGVHCWASDTSNLDNLFAQILGPEDSPYWGGLFCLKICICDRYPMEPPDVRFLTPIYHPNIDKEGRICLDILKMPPQGNWRPSITIATLLSSIRLLMVNPNAEDPLEADIAALYQSQRLAFLNQAKLYTKKYAMSEKRVNAMNFNDAADFNPVDCEKKTNALIDKSPSMTMSRSQISNEENIFIKPSSKKVCLALNKSP